jgi:hypothetical protein
MPKRSAQISGLPRTDDTASEARRRLEDSNERYRSAAQTGIEHDPIMRC